MDSNAENSLKWCEKTAQLFDVYNTSHRSILVLADDREAAKSVAWTYGHLRHSDNGLDGDDRNSHVIEFPGEGRLSEAWQVLQKAASEGHRGIVRLEEGLVMIGTSSFKI